MMQNAKHKNVSFVNVLEAQAVRKKIAEQKARISSALAVLREYEEPATLDALKTYTERGFEYLREGAIKECREYIRSTKMPQYLQAEALQRAYKSVNQEFLDAMQNALVGLELPADLSVLKLDPDSGEYRFSDAYVTAEIEQKRYTLTNAEQADFIKFKEALRLLGEAEAGSSRFTAFDTLADYRLRADSSDEVVASALKAYQRRSRDD